ncbi:hypothetical protein [Nocardioides pantholopis]|uniref:hypothetical protein n=1 Tax=Nocardioides pantholopis TaxID=2483798 RepID=UPI001F14EB19|nr:hypothetical protein [Nocardioides pantholopis]
MDQRPPAGSDQAGGLVEPLSPALQALLRRAVLDHAVLERRRWFPTLVHVGTPGGAESVFADRPDEPTDHALRTDLVAALLARHRRTGATTPALVWLTRPGELELQDVDAAWLAAAGAASAEAGRVGLTVVVVNRHGWRDPRTGLHRTWVRLRRR